MRVYSRHHNVNVRQDEMDALNSFAVVAYLSGPLADFVDSLRHGFTPGCTHRAHVTLLPPRPLRRDPREAIEFCRTVAGRTSPFEITAGDVEKFSTTDVIKLSVRDGDSQLRRLHAELNAGPLLHEERYVYEPHVTLAQDLPSDRLDECIEQARASWERFASAAVFSVRSLTFVQEGESGVWRDLASIAIGHESPHESASSNGVSNSALLAAGRINPAKRRS